MLTCYRSVGRTDCSLKLQGSCLWRTAVSRPPRGCRDELSTPSQFLGHHIQTFIDFLPSNIQYMLLRLTCLSTGEDL